MVKHKLKPCVGLQIILWNTSALIISQTQIPLGPEIFLFSGKEPPLHRFFVILRNTIALVIIKSQTALRGRISLFSDESALPHYLFFVL